MMYLFRRGAPHHFITTQDTEYAYDYICGHCDYPVEPTDEGCPRCQRELDDCPICVRRTHRRAIKVVPDVKRGGKVCPVCGYRRFRFGERSVTEIAGKFCGNLYGCPAGGMLIAAEELAILPEHASSCSLCRQQELPPLDVRTFIYLITGCTFCNTIFGSLPGWMTQSPDKWSPSIDKLRPATRKENGPCPLCGRRDVVSEDGLRVTSAGIRLEALDRQLEMSVGEYLRVAELARALILFDVDDVAFDHTFDAWFSPLGGDLPDPTVPVSRIARYLLDGTIRPAVNDVLKERLQPFQEAWEKRLPGGLGFNVSCSQTQET